ncbi:MAG: hypothetical protein JNK87_15150 [Bryobacterales bacterium]|nr:hypothetical protein [Bryobacterales bacterium]
MHITLLLLLATSSLPAQQAPLQFSLLSLLYLSLTPAQASAIEANNAAYTQAQRAGISRTLDSNRRISAEIQKEEPSADVIGTAYQELETLCRQRQTALTDLLQKNQAALTELQRTRLFLLRNTALRQILSSRLVQLGLATTFQFRPAVSPTNAGFLVGGTGFEGVGLVEDPRLGGIGELFELLGLSEEQAGAILSAVKSYAEDASETFTRMIDASVELRRSLAGGSSDAGSLAVEIEKLRREIANRQAGLRQQNLATLDETQRRRLNELLTPFQAENYLYESEAQRQYLLEVDLPHPDRPATVATFSANSPEPQPVTYATLYPGGSRVFEPYSALRTCVAGPQ